MDIAVISAAAAAMHAVAIITVAACLVSRVVVEITLRSRVDQWKLSASTKDSTSPVERSCSESSSRWNTAWKRAHLLRAVSPATSIRGYTSATNTATWRRATRRTHTRSSFTSAKCRAVSETHTQCNFFAMR